MKNNRCFKVKPKNDQQQEALETLCDPDIDLVILEGAAGSGKTFLALAAGLGQVLDYKTYKEILFTRAPIGVGVDMGYLPGDEQDKLAPWCGALFDNIETLVGGEDLTNAFIRTKIKIKAMQFMRGRSLMNKYVIIDEVQNMAPSELKVLVTRAGEGTKIVVMDDTSQIDNKRLNKSNNALSHLIESVDYMPVDFVRYIHLPESERSRLCSWASLAL